MSLNMHNYLTLSLPIKYFDYDIQINNKYKMPRNSKNSSESRSRSRSPKNKRYRKSSSRSDSSIRKKHTNKDDKKEKDYYSKPSFSFKNRSDIKNHIIYENVKVRHKSDESQIMASVKNLLQEQLGPIEHITKTSSGQGSFSFFIGFKYDKDAMRFIREGSTITSIDKTKLYGKPTLVFDHCLSMFKELARQAKKNQKRAKSPESRKYKRSSSSDRDRDHKRKRQRQSPRRKSHEKKQSKKQYKYSQKSVWVFGLPWSIKGKEVQTYLADQASGPFPVIKWKWMRVKNSNCEFMQLTLDEKKASKLLNLRQQLQIEHCPCIIAPASSDETQEIIKATLKDYQFKVTFPERINPSLLYKALNDIARVVQIVSCQKLVDGRSDSFIVTLGSASKAKDIKRLGLLSSSGIRVEEVRGQLVFRPTKHSKLTENEH